MTEQEIEKLQALYDKATNIVFFGGAGVSTESGIPDFRSPNGLYSQKYKWNYSAEEMLSHTFFMRHTEEFFDFYKTILPTNVMPNSAHKTLAEMERKGKLKAVITQNIDGLHQKAGSKTVYELHGSMKRNYCMKCGTFYDDEETFYDDKGDLKPERIPKCKKCGGTIKPDVVLYEEGLDDSVLECSLKALHKADLLIIAGTSLVVQPAASLIYYYGGKDIVLINREQLSNVGKVSLFIQDKVGEVLSKLKL